MPSAASVRELAVLVVDELDGEGLGADEVEQDLEDDLRQLAQLERRVQLERRHVEVGEVVVLALDVVIAVVEVAVEPLDAGEARHQRLALALERLDARDQLAQRAGAAAVRRRRLRRGRQRAPLLLELHDPEAQLLVLAHQLFGELCAALEEGLDELALGLDEVELREGRLVVRFRHSRAAMISEPGALLQSGHASNCRGGFR